MLELKNIKKDYKIANTDFTALHDITLSFRKSEFVAVLGPSGCGKTTLLNIVGGLDQYTAGDLIIEGKSTKNFNDKDWDYYRNNKVGFVFQNYHLINHISIIDNVEMGMTLSGVSKAERRERAKEVLIRVGLEDQMYKKSNQLSGGQKQRVAIARALANDPEIILADEPTGALDSKTSVQILNLIKEISKEKLVIMVTHNEELAETYATRTINLLDGNVIGDSNPYTPEKTEEDTYKPKKTSMSYFQAISLSFRNLGTKLGRTLTTSLAGSIGIIGVILVLSLGNGFNGIVRELETETLASVPLMITEVYQSMNYRDYLQEVKDTGYVQPYDPSNRGSTHFNIFTPEYLTYLEENLDPSTYTSIEYNYRIQQPIVSKQNDSYDSVNTQGLFSKLDPLFLKNYYDIARGDYAKDGITDGVHEVMIVLNKKYGVSMRLLEALGLSTDPNTVKYEDLIGIELKMSNYNDFYMIDDSIAGKQVYRQNSDLSTAYNSDNAITIKVVGVLVPKEDSVFSMPDGLYHSQALTKAIISMAKASNVVAHQKTVDYAAIDFSFDNRTIPAGTDFPKDEEGNLTEVGRQLKKAILSYLGDTDVPNEINIYPTSYESKEAIKKVLDKYNMQFSDEDKAKRIMYMDLAETIGGALGQVVNMIQIVLVIFASISLVVSSIMIGIITYVSVLERTQEIGILRALGARKKDIKRVFNSETFLIGLAAGLLGSIISFILTFPINAIVVRFNDQMAGVVKMSIVHALIMIAISVLLTYVAGLIPSAFAARKHPVDALRHNE